MNGIRTVFNGCVHACVCASVRVDNEMKLQIDESCSAPTLCKCIQQFIVCTFN